MLKKLNMKSAADMLERDGSHFGEKKRGSREFLNVALEKSSDQQAREGRKLKAKKMDERETSV